MKGTRDKEPRILTPSDILSLEDTEGKERTCLLCPASPGGLSPATKEVRTTVILEKPFYVCLRIVDLKHSSPSEQLADWLEI